MPWKGAPQKGLAALPSRFFPVWGVHPIKPAQTTAFPAVFYQIVNFFSTLCKY